MDAESSDDDKNSLTSGWGELRQDRWGWRNESGSWCLNVWMSKPSLTLAQILFPQCPAKWRAESCQFSDTKSVKTARWRIVCAMPCHLSRLSYELFTKCVTPNVTYVHLTISLWQVVNLRNKFLNISEVLPRHGTHYVHLIRVTTHPHAHCHEFSPIWHAQLRAMA